jgi:O-acetyl-ADP-ribose deacetylase (regulator of RNase III)
MSTTNQATDRAGRPLAAGYRGLFYITHIDNLSSILRRGIFCHERITREGIQFTPIYDEAIVAGRHQRKVPDGRSLWSFANLFFQPRNAMLYRVLLEKSCEEIAILCVNPTLLNRGDIYIALGGAGSERSPIVSRDAGLRWISRSRKYIDREWWSDVDDSKRLSMAECLVPDSVSASMITTLYVASHELRERLLNDMPELHGISTIAEPYMFFKPEFEKRLTAYLSLIKGDMFFSKMHTLTISVNCVGVMGKGVASRAKYLFPAAYVYYQDLCRERRLQLGKPYLYKRENSVEVQLADEPFSLPHVNTETWYLLFPTKSHWRLRADLEGIKQGLRWIQENYRKEGIRSLALPALGCGLGWLEWRDVGPVLSQYLSTLDIPVQIYLPTEKEIPREYLAKEFLLP